MADLPTTQRAYTLRLRGAATDDHTWREMLWRTHVAVNRGAKAFGDWLLTLRGGLCHTLADAKISVGKGKPDRLPKEPERRQRRIMLALSWLSVESHETERDAPVAHFVAVRDSVPQTVEALRTILANRGVEESEIADWVRDCGDSLRANIREKARWVNRSLAFDAAVQRVGSSLNRTEIWDVFDRFFGDADAYLGTADASAQAISGAKGDGDAEQSETSIKAAASEKSDDRGLGVEANGWLRDRFGTGKGADFSLKAREYSAFAAWCREFDRERSPSELLAALKKSLAVDKLPRRLAATSGESNGVQTAYEEVLAQLELGNPPAMKDWSKLASLADGRAEEKLSKVGKKGHKDWTSALLSDVERSSGIEYLNPNDGTQRGWEYCVILDHAARRVSQTHSWIKLAEAERNEFEKDARKIDQLKAEHPAIVEWLDQFCRDRSRDTGTADDDGYRIRKGAISDWSDVVTRWSGAKCQTVDDRIAAAREVQADPENDKPGDNQLYEALAQEDAKLVWFVDDQPNAQPLKDYVTARQAEHNKRRFKVPAYRHPDELRHPVFCDFGESRWSIDFAAHRVGGKQASAQSTVERREADVTKALLAIEKAKTEEKREAAQEKLVLAQRSLDESQRELAWLVSRQGLRMKLWDGQTLEDRPLTWQSKRLRSELTPSIPTTKTTSAPVPVSRANRLALAAGNAASDSRLNVMGLLDLKEWNGRLQAPRAALNRIADIRDGVKCKRLSPAERSERVAKMTARLHWLVTYSARLQPQGPWTDFAEQYAASHPGKSLMDLDRGEVVTKPKQSRDEWRGLAFPFWHPLFEKGRAGRARQILSHLPNLRILSVDLGHRYAAACAVWEAISTKELQAACALAGCGVPSREALCWFTPRGGDKPGRVVYRRIGDDTLTDGSPHPAPWARLDRQFLIKLQGEDEPARAATNEERAAVEVLEDELGYQRREPRKPADWRIDELMSDVVRTVRLALRNHGDYARIASGLIATDKRGMGKNDPTKLEDKSLVEHLVGLLDIWHELAKSLRWKDEFASKAWEEQIQPRLIGITLEEDTESMTGPQRKAARAERQKQLTSVAEQLEKLGREGRMPLHVAWQQAWADRDKQWQKKLRWLSRWIMPRGKDESGKPRKNDRSVRNVGGLSLNRIATFKSLYQVQKAFFTRQKPDDKKPEPAGEGFGQRTLDALERMRQNRVKQLASRIAEAALGVGIERSRTEKGKQLKRPRERIADPRFAPCHAVVIENLTHYRPDELQTRRENRQLMTWASAQVKKHLTDQCQLHGLHLREVQPGYTSRQDFRTGAPGIRCVDVPVAEFLGEPNGKPGRHVRQAIKNLLKDEPRRMGTLARLPDTINTEETGKSAHPTEDWLAKLDLARGKVLANAGTAWDRYVLDLFDHLNKPTAEFADKVTSRFVRLPQKGGDVFVSADNPSSNGESKGPPGVQADLNAAGNIGLKALLDPDWHGAWWYIPAGLDANGWRVPNEKSTAGAACLNDWRVGEVKSGLYQSADIGGRPLSLADDEQVRAAATLVEKAKARLDSAKAETKKAQRGKSSLSHDAAMELEVVAKTAHDEAKKCHATAKKGANAKAVVNLWRFLSRHRPHDCEWHEYSAYENLVRWRAIRTLRHSIRLGDDAG